MPAALSFETASAATEPELRRLLRENPVSGEILVSLEREPDAFRAARVSGDSYQIMLALEGERRRLVGTGARFELTAWINGAPKRIGYLGELRTDGGLRQRRTLFLESFRTIRRYHDESGRVSFYLTTIVSDNTPARRLLESGVGDMPTYRALEEMITFTIPARAGARRRTALEVSVASESRLADIVDLLARNGPRYQFEPVWSEATLRSGERCRGLAAGDFLLCQRGDQLVGCLALWDQRAFKQAVIRGYSPRLGRLRPLYNLAAPLLARPRLPAPGSRLESAFLSHVVAAPDDEEALATLVATACQAALRRGLDYVMLAFATRDPRAGVIRKRFPCHNYRSMVYVVYWEDGQEAAGQLDDRVPHPEVAIL